MGETLNGFDMNRCDLLAGAILNKMEEKLIKAIKELLEVKHEILGHIEFCRVGLSEDYEYLFDNLEDLVNEAEG